MNTQTSNPHTLVIAVLAGAFIVLVLLLVGHNVGKALQPDRPDLRVTCEIHRAGGGAIPSECDGVPRPDITLN